MEILNYLIDEDKMNYQCFNVLKYLLETNEEFRCVISKGISLGKISKFPESLWEKIRKQNIRVIDNFEDVFKDGANIGYCTVASKQLSYSFDTCFICGGVLPIISGTNNSPDGSHTWLLVDNKIIDTTLMIIIDSSFASSLGYKEENRYDPNLDPIYAASKEWTNDTSLKRNN